MGGTQWTRISLLIMFGKFEKKFGRHDNKEKKLLGECILYNLSLVNVSSFASYLLLYWAWPLSNISGLLMTQSIQHFKLLVEHWDYCKMTQNGTHACGKHVSIKMQRGLGISLWLFYYSTLFWIWKCYGKDIETICCMICGIDASRMEALPRMPIMTPYYSSRPN